MKNYAIFAHYDADGVIEDYVLFYLRRLREVCDYIVFVSDSDLKQNEINKLTALVDNSIVERHGEYDFGSYKRGYYAIKSIITENDRLVLCNDSCFGPTYSLKPFFEKIENSSVDVWSMIFSGKDKEFMMSFFLVINSKMFTNQKFEAFLNSVEKNASKDDVVLNCEIGLSRLARNLGCVVDSFIKNEDILGANKSILKSDFEKLPNGKWFYFLIKPYCSFNVYGDNNFYLSKLGFPFIKKLAFYNKDSFFLFYYPYFISKDYPTGLISKYIENKNINMTRDSFGKFFLRRVFSPFKQFSLTPFRFSKTRSKDGERLQVKIFIFGIRILSFKKIQK